MAKTKGAQTVSKYQETLILELPEVGHKPSEIATTTGIPRNTVKVILLCARFGMHFPIPTLSIWRIQWRIAIKQ